MNARGCDVCSHWPAKFSTSACDFGSCSMRCDLPVETFGSRSCAVAGQVEQLVVGHAAPEEIGEARGEFPIVELALGPGIVGLRIELDAEQEARGDEHRGRGQAEGGLEGSSWLRRR